MSLKTSLINFGKRVKIAVENYAEVHKKGKALTKAYDYVCVFDNIDHMPAGDDYNLGESGCKITYCTEDWMGFLNECAPGTTVHTCPSFNGNKCKDGCKMRQANNAFFDATLAYEQARQNYKNSVKQIFGVRVKQ